jgi:hypothetical protein
VRPAPAGLDVPPGDPQLRAVAFAALAVGCILAMPVHLLLAERAGPSLPTLPFALGFLAVFVAGTRLLRRFRGAANAAAIAAAVCGLAALLAGGVNRNFLILRLLAAVPVAAGAIWLAFRDWRYPLHGEIGWGAFAIGVEAVLGTAAGLSAWRIPLAVMIPAFFAASLASRAVTIWHDPEADPTDARAWMNRIPVAFAAYVVCVVALAAAALRGGIFQRLGSIFLPVASVIITLLLLAVELVFSPIVWLVSRFHVNTQGWQRLLQSLGDGSATTSRFPPSHGALGGTLFRILGFVLFSLLIWAIFRALRRVRAPEVPASTRTGRSPVASVTLQDEAPPTGRRPSLPADQVRRWYVEALLALERRHVHKDPSLTPAEFAREVGRTLPELRDDLDPLTRAYEDVRYGNVQLGDVTLRELRAHHRALIATLRRPPDRGEPVAT